MATRTVVVSGSVLTGALTLTGVTFASSAEILDGLLTAKTISPAGLRSAMVTDVTAGNDAAPVGVDPNTPRLPAAVTAATQGATSADLAPGNVVAWAPKPATKALARLTSPATEQQLRWASFGDSVAMLKMRYMYPLLQRAWGGYVAGAGPGRDVSGTGYRVVGIQPSSQTGTITATSAPTEWFGGFVEDYATGATSTYRIDAAEDPYWRYVKVFYIKRPGGGTFKVQVAGVDDPSGTIDTNNATVALGILTIDKTTVAQRSFKIVNLTGTVRIAGPMFINPDVNGIIHAAVNQGGLDIGAIVESAAALGTLTTFLVDFNPDVITFEAKEDIVNWGTNASTMFAAMRAACPTAVIIGIGTTPRTDLAESVTLAENAALKAACLANACDYFDGYTPVAPGTKLTALGWAGDGVHPAEECNAFLGGLLLDRFHLLNHPALVDQGGDVTTQRVRSRLDIGEPRNDGAVTPNGAIVPDTTGDLDISFFLRRKLIVADAADEVTDQYSWVLDPASAGVENQIPNLCRVGDVGPNLWGLTDRIAASTSGGALREFQARAYISQFASASVSGAVTRDLSLGSGQLLTLTGNITSFAFSNPGTTGTVVEVHFIQDGTGSRTLAGVDAAIRLAGGALTLTTTAGRRDIIRFRQISGVYYEISRSMNLT